MARSEESAERVEDVEIRPLRDHAEYRETLEVQRLTWGFSESDRVPPRLMIVGVEIGGLALGAFSGGRLIGFSVAFPGRKEAEAAEERSTFWHSHMTGVLPEWQGRGIGRRIKLAQREEALRAGVEVVEWTFDPLEIRNAYFNIERLGIIVRRFLPNQYGITSSRLHGGLPTDRLVAEWHVGSERVGAVIEKAERNRDEVAATIDVPRDIADLRVSDSESAREIQTRVREQFQQSFAEGLTVVGYRLDENTGAYELGRPEKSSGMR